MGFIGVQPTSVPLTASDITDGIVTSAKISDGTITATDMDLSGTYAFTGTVTGAGQSLRPNQQPLIMNGNMAVSQRGTSFSNPSDGEYTLDRWEAQKNHDGAITVSQEALTSGNAYNDGFKNALKCDITTADTSLGSGQKFFIQQIIEAQHLQLLKFGTSSAEKLTLSFWVKATKTGTNVVRMYAYDDDRSCSQSYTISSSNTWEKKVLNFPADTTGVIDNNNGHGIQISWALMAASNFQSGTLATTWAANASANDFVGQVNHMDSTSNTWHITGVQLEVGEYTSSSIPNFQHEDFGTNIVRCKRYFQRIGQSGYGGNTMLIGITTNGNQMFMARLPVSMRSAPTISMTGTSLTVYSTNSSANVSASNPTLSAGTFGTDGGRLLYSKIGDNGHGSWIDIDNTSTFFNFSSEL